MRKKSLHPVMTRLFLITFLISAFVACDKSVPEDGVNVPPYYNLDATLLPATGKEAIGKNGAGLIKFRQDPDTARIITLDTWLFHLQPNHSYLLQRAVDPIANGSCSSTVWLTLGKGLVPQSIVTDDKGNGHEELFRNITAIARGTQFWIHFQILDEATLMPVLTSDCYQYTVR
jgi:hypothetical protein